MSRTIEIFAYIWRTKYKAVGVINKEKLRAYLAKRLEEMQRPGIYNSIHKAPCKNCPAHNNKLHGITDPESEDIKSYCKTKQELMKHVYTCGWRPNKLCKGICDDYGLDEQFLKDNGSEEFFLNDRR